MREDCTTCKNGERMVGVIFCKNRSRAMTTTTNKCDEYEMRLEQTKLGE